MSACTGSSAADDKFTAHNAAPGRADCSSRVPKGTELDRSALRPRRGLDDAGATFWRLLVVAEREGSRFSLIEEYTSPHRMLAGYSNGAVGAVRRAGRQARVRLPSEPRPGGLELRPPIAPRSGEMPSSTGWQAASAPGGARWRIHNDFAGQGATSRVTGAYFADRAAPRLRHVPAAPGPVTTPTSPSRARSASRRASSGAG